MIDPTNKGIIDINAPVDVSILAGLLGISAPMVYDGRKDGKLPANTQASYRECINQYVNFYKSKIAAKSGSMYEAKLEQDIRNGIAKEAGQWLEIKKAKEEVADIYILNELFLPIFHIVRTNLLNLTRQFPETTPVIDRVLESWHTLGVKIATRAKQDSQAYVQAQLDKEIKLPEAEDMALNSFGVEK